MKYTKGEWKVEGFNVFDNDGHSIASCGTYSERKHGECITNAHLISAAPDMYEALKEARLHCSGGTNLISRIDQAIAKAEGK